MVGTTSPYDYARKRIVSCSLDEPISKCTVKLQDEDIGSLLVKDKDGNFVGMLTDKLIFEAISDGLDLSKLRVKDLKLEPLVTVDKDANFDEIMEKFKETPSNRLVMIGKDGKIVGILKKKNIERFSKFDIMSFLVGRKYR